MDDTDEQTGRQHSQVAWTEEERVRRLAAVQVEVRQQELGTTC